MPDERKFRFGSKPVPFRACRVASHLQFLPGEQRRQHQLGHVFRQRRNRGENQRGGPPRKTVTGSG